MKIAYLTIFDPSNVHAWSGLGVYILRALQAAGFETVSIGNLRYEYDFIYKMKDIFYNRMTSKTYHMLWDPMLLQRFAVQAERALASIDCDLVFSLWINPIAYLRTKKLIVFWGDATFAGLQDFYPDYRHLCAETIRGGNRAEQLALSKCRLAIFSSDWAANSAIDKYGIASEKVKVVPFGANISCSRARQDINALLESKDFDVCRLLFIGKEWFRKGGDIAVQVVDRLNRRGLPTELHVVGCKPPAQLPGFVKVHGFVSKTEDAGSQLLDRLFSESHFFILPTRADCTPVVFPEACSFGLPSLTTNVGGIPTVIQDGKNGQTFAVDDGPEAYCDYIESLWSSKGEYERLALSSFGEYTERLNWTAAGHRVYELIQEFCA